MINGQKVWTTSAHKAHWGLLLARANWDVAKHKGLAYFILDMKQPGVQVHPLKQMNGHASFNQVFFTDAMVEPEFLVCRRGRRLDGGDHDPDARAPRRRRAAQLGDGLRHARAASTRRSGPRSRTTMEPYKWYPQRAGRVDLVLERAKATGKINDPVIRQEIAKLLIMSKAAEWTARRARAAQEQGRPQGPEGSLGKLVSSHVARQAARVHTYITGADALLSGEDSPMDGVIAEILVSVPATSIAGGTDEIQRNIISERVLEDAQGAQRRHRQAVQGRAEEHRRVLVRDGGMCYPDGHAPSPDRVTLDAEKPGGYSKFPWYALRQNYLDAIDAAGGLAVALPHEPDRVADYLERIDALVVTGGAFDVDPSYYGGGARTPR